MKSETITERADLIIRRHILQPGEALPWHTDRCHRFTVVVSGEALSIVTRARWKPIPSTPAWQTGMSRNRGFIVASTRAAFLLRK